MSLLVPWGSLAFLRHPPGSLGCFLEFLSVPLGFGGLQETKISPKKTYVKDDKNHVNIEKKALP